MVAITSKASTTNWIKSSGYSKISFEHRKWNEGWLGEFKVRIRLLKL